MKALARIEATWTKFDYAFEKELPGATTAAKASIFGQQVINDQAYFILFWGQLEAEVDAVCRTAVNRRRLDPDWQVRRAWDLYHPNEPRFSGLSFENRARLVLDGQGGRASPSALTLKHYGSRNQIAHGELQATRIDVSAFVADWHLIQAALHRAT